MIRPTLATLTILAFGLTVIVAPAPAAESTVNSLGMTMVRIEPGSFLMGTGEGGDFDERPVRKVTIARPFYMAATEVTNAQFERFDPGHKKLRGMRGLSIEDDEAVVFVSWLDAEQFCRWLSEKEGKPYRLPTEAEWEYACRAGTTGAYHAGDELPEAYQKNQIFSWDPVPVGLGVGQTPANPWGLHEMHGNVEEWCHDWYGPYEAADVTDPVGRAAGLFKVARGGSHNTGVEFLRSANRLGTLPDDKHWLIGFRPVMGALPDTPPAGPPAAPRWAEDVDQTEHDWSGGPDMQSPYFGSPVPFVKVPADSNGPLFSAHNHCPSITFCPNGDLFAVWFTTNTERGREMAVAAARLRRGDGQWETASLLFKAPDRNMTGASLFNDGRGTLYHFNGLEAGDGWANLALVLRTSRDNGVTWRTRLINPHHRPRNQVIDGTSATAEGHIIQPCDAVYGGTGGTAIHISRDGGETWIDPGAGTEKPDFHGSDPGSTIAGIHGGVVELRDGRLLAFGRGDNRLGSNENIGQRMPRSISSDLGRSWNYSASPFPPIGGNQRLVLRRLDEGPLLFVSFTDDYFGYKRSKKGPKGMVVEDSQGNPQTVYGMFAAVSFDEGKTWPIRKPITPGGPARMMRDVVLTGGFLLDATHAEPRGYLAATQTPDGVIHLISSGLHYRFNLAWLKRPMDPPPPEPKPADHPVKGQLSRVFKPTGLPSKAAQPWKFTGSGIEESDAVSFTQAGMSIDTGDGQRARWANSSPAGFAVADSVNGLTAEIRMQVVKSSTKNRGIDFEFHALGGRYFLTITRTAVYFNDGGFQLVADDLDNHSAMHTYRIAVDSLGRAQIFRDLERIALREPAGGLDNMVGTKGAYLQWGDGAGAAETDAIIERVAYDPRGPFAPASE